MAGHPESVQHANSWTPRQHYKHYLERLVAKRLPVVVGVHTPEFSFEKERVNVENASRDLRVTYPVAIDSNYAIWQAFNNQYCPA